MVIPSHRTLGVDFAECVRNLKSLRLSLIDSESFMSTNNVSANLLLETYTSVIKEHVGITHLLTHDNINEHAQFQFSDGTLNVVREFNFILVELINVRDSILATIPSRSPDNYIQIQKLASTGVDVRSFTPIETASLRAALISLINVIGNDT